MKRETLRHPKTYDLAARLGCSRPEALGYLTLLWDYTSEVAPQGDIGKWPNGAIARGCDFDGCPDAFVEALVGAGWLDEDETHRLIIHDIEHHAEQWWKQKVKKLGLQFAKPTPQFPLSEDQTTPRSPLSEDQTPDQCALPHVTEPNLTEPNLTEPNLTSTSGSRFDERSDSQEEFVFPLRDGSTWKLKPDKLSEYVDSFPEVDVPAQVRGMIQWARDNPKKRKTRTGMGRFITNWLIDERDSVKSNGSHDQPSNAEITESLLARSGNG